LKCVLYVPTLARNLISVGSLTDDGNLVLFTNKQCMIMRNDASHTLLATGSRDMRNGLYRDGPTSKVNLSLFQSTNDSSMKPADIRLWHLRYGHLYYAGLYHLSQKDKVRGLPHLKMVHDICPDCMAGCQHRERFPKASSHRTFQVLALIHTDLVGPLKVASLSGSRYFIVFTDDFSRKSWVYFLKTKGEAFQRFREFKSRVEKETGRSILTLRSDQGGEYLSREFINYCKSEGITHQLTMARTPQQNGVAERRNRTIIERACSMGSASQCPGFLWTELVNTATYLINISPTRSNNGNTPDQLYYQTLPRVDHLRIFGSICYLHVLKESRSKLESKTKQCIFLGYDDQSKAYRVYDPIHKRIYISQDIIFDEQHFGFNFLQTATSLQPEPPIFLELTYDSEDSNPASPIHSSSGTTILPFDFDQSPVSNPPSPSPTSSPLQPESPVHSPPTAPIISNPPIRYHFRERKPNTKFRDHYVFNTSKYHPNSRFPIEPRHFYEATQHPGWAAAKQKEIDSVLENDTWQLTEHVLPGKTPIHAMWIFKAKYNPSSQIEKLKARIVAKGNEQAHGIDYLETFAPVVRWTTIRSVIALAARNSWQLQHLDVITAFLNGFLSEDIYMIIPPGFPHAGQTCKLIRALYGLRQASRAWYTRIDSFLQTLGLSHSKEDPNLYFFHKNGKHTIILLYVDDIIITGNDTQNINYLKRHMMTTFRMTDLGNASCYLVVEIQQAPEGIYFH
jgi:transposase InsO family protein